MSTLSDAELQRFAQRLHNWPPNGKPEMDDDVFTLKALGLIEEIDITKPCALCGTSRRDYSFMKVTLAGRIFLRAMDNRL